MGMRIIQGGGVAKITDTMLKTSLECKVINISRVQPIFCEIEIGEVKCISVGFATPTYFYLHTIFFSSVFHS